MNRKFVIKTKLAKNIVLSFLFLSAMPRVCLANGNACKRYYIAAAVEGNVRRIQENLISSLKNDSVQVTVATEYYLQKLKTELGGGLSSSDAMAAKVNDIIAEVTQMRELIDRTDSTMPRTEVLRLKVKKFSSDFSKPGRSSKNLQKKAALAKEILTEFNAIKEDKAHFSVYLKRVAEMRSRVQDQLQNIEYEMASVSSYKQALEPVITNFENELSRTRSQSPIGLALSQLMNEQNGSTMSLRFLSFSHTGLSSSLQMLSSIDQTIRSQQQNTLTTFLLETGLSPSLLEGEILRNAEEQSRLDKESETKIAAVAAAKVAQKVRFQNQVADVKAKFRKLKGAAIVASSLVVGGGGLVQLYNAGPEHQIEKYQPEIAKVINLAKQATFENQNLILLENLPLAVEKLSPNEFLVYVKELTLASKSIAIARYVSRWTDLSVDDVIELAKKADSRTQNDILFRYGTTRKLTKDDTKKIVKPLFPNFEDGVLRYQAKIP